MGFITNNSFLDGRTHRKMREHLARAFDEIYILNLHGDEKDDENVFDIRVGVYISLFVKYKENSNQSGDTKSESVDTLNPLREGDTLSPPPLRRGFGSGYCQRQCLNLKDDVSKFVIASR